MDSWTLPSMIRQLCSKDSVISTIDNEKRTFSENEIYTQLGYSDKEFLGDDSYNEYITHLRTEQYPMLKDTIYLDHAGTTLCSKSLIDRFSRNMLSDMISNPHSASGSAQATAKRIDNVRTRLLQMFGADPDYFDIVFVANATAGIKLVADALRDHDEGFWYGYHRDCHTSLVGVRELSKSHRCFKTDNELETWVTSHDFGCSSSADATIRLLAYPAQSNMNGRRLPLDWCNKIRIAAKESKNRTYILLDAAALVSTAPLDLSLVASAPDFVVLSLYKIFGFPDLGCLIVKKTAEDAFDKRRYFGGGVVDMVVCLREDWHARKTESLHGRLEDGTLPIHSIIAAENALEVHKELFGSMSRVSRHVSYLTRRLIEGLASLKHFNGVKVCELYIDIQKYHDSRIQGPIVAFNIRNSRESWFYNSEVEKLAALRKIEFRTGSHCNPGGIAHTLDLAPWEMKENFSAGLRCGSDNDVMSGHPTGTIRLSVGAMSTTCDVDSFLSFMKEFFVEDRIAEKGRTALQVQQECLPSERNLYVESLTIYPIKSCAGWNVGKEAWEVRKEGLAWDREWCLVHAGTNTALSQKRYPKMALIRPRIDLENGLLRVFYSRQDHSSEASEEVAVPLSADPRCFDDNNRFRSVTAKVCGDSISAKLYSSVEISKFFSDFLGVSCRLARFPAVNSADSPSRYAKAHLQSHQITQVMHVPGAFPSTSHPERAKQSPQILLSNESPILIVSRASFNQLNRHIKKSGGREVHIEAFRANIIVSPHNAKEEDLEQPYIEDSWRSVKIGQESFEILGPCRRCQMVCIDQETAERSEEPFVTLAKTRRFDGKVLFGQHATLLLARDASSARIRQSFLSVGDSVLASQD